MSGASRSAAAVAVLGGLLAGTGRAVGANAPLEALRAMPARYDAVRDYTTLFVMEERAGGRLSPRQEVEFKFARPHKVYMRWLSGPARGREVIYVEGENGNKLVAHEVGFFGFRNWWIDPRGLLAMRGHRRPIVEAGVGFTIERVLGLVDRQIAPAVIVDRGAGSVAEHATRDIELRVPPGSDPMSAVTIHVSLDTELGLPIHEEEFDGDGQLLESATYGQLALNVGLGPSDFDPNNPAYGFR